MTEDELNEIEARAAATSWPPVWNEVKTLVQEDVPALCAALREAWAVRDAAIRWMRQDYLAWTKAGGPDECEHGYAKGLPCPSCDYNLVFREQPQAQAQEGESGE